VGCGPPVCGAHLRFTDPQIGRSSSA
jgi:hypothetical protein